jgi:hypothetical protein
MSSCLEHISDNNTHDTHFINVFSSFSLDEVLLISMTLRMYNHIGHNVCLVKWIASIHSQDLFSVSHLAKLITSLIVLSFKHQNPQEGLDALSMAGSDEDCGMSWIPGAEERGWSRTGWVLGGRMIERSGDAVCGLYHAQGDKERGFLGLASKPRSIVSPCLASKSVASGFSVWASKLIATVW